MKAYRDVNVEGMYLNLIEDFMYVRTSILSYVLKIYRKQIQLHSILLIDKNLARIVAAICNIHFVLTNWQSRTF